MHPESSLARQFVASSGFVGIGPNWSAKRSYTQMYGLIAVMFVPIVVIGVLGAGNRQLGEMAGAIWVVVGSVALISASLAQAPSATPEMVISLAGMPPLTIACRDVAGVSYLQGRFSWRGDLPQRVNDAAEYSVSGADWQILVEKFCLATYLETHR